MNFPVNRSEFSKALRSVQGVATEKGISVLGHVLIEADGDNLRISATDLEIWASVPCPLEAPVADGRMCVPAKRMSDIVKEMSCDTVSVSIAEDGWLNVTGGKSKFRLATVKPDEYPQPQQTGSGSACATMLAGRLSGLLAHTLYAVGERDARYTLNGALFEFDGSITLTVVATDGHRLAMDTSILNADEPMPPMRCILPQKAAVEVKKLCDSNPNAPVLIQPQGGCMSFDFDGGTSLNCRLLEGSYPNYRGILPTPAYIATANVSELLALARRAGVVADSRDFVVKVTIGDNTLAMQGDSSYGSATESMPVDCDCEPVTIGMNARYFVAALSAMAGGDNVQLGFTDGQTAMTINDCKTASCVLMPMRT